MADSQSAQWWPDPFSRHELRYWDGEQWTEHVSDAGAVRIDPPVPTPRVAIDLTVAERLHSGRRAASNDNEGSAWAPSRAGRPAAGGARSTVAVAPFAGLTAESFDTPAVWAEPFERHEPLGAGEPFERSAPFRGLESFGGAQPFGGTQPFAVGATPATPDLATARRRDRVPPVPDEDDWAAPPVIEFPDGVLSLADRLSPYTVDDRTRSGHAGQPGAVPGASDADGYSWAGPDPVTVHADPRADHYGHLAPAADAVVEAHRAGYPQAEVAGLADDPTPRGDQDLWAELAGDPRAGDPARSGDPSRIGDARATEGLSRRRRATTTTQPGVAERLRACQHWVAEAVDWRVSWLPEIAAVVLVAAVIGLAALLAGGDSSPGTADVSAVVAPTAKPTTKPSTAVRKTAKQVSGPKVSTARASRTTYRPSSRHTTSARRTRTSTTTSAPVASPTTSSTNPRKGPKSPNADAPSSPSSQPAPDPATTDPTSTA